MDLSLAKIEEDPDVVPLRSYSYVP